MSAFSVPFVPAVLILAIAAGYVGLPSAHSQPPSLLTDEPLPVDRAVDATASDDSAPPQAGDGEAGETESRLTPEQLAQAQQWIEQLGAAEFAKRERAAEHLVEMGNAILPELRRVIEHSSDPETRLRAQQISSQLTDGDLQARITEFLAGRDVRFSGWYAAQGILGDSLSVRELFVEMMLAHPDVVASLDGTARDRSLALEQLVLRVQEKLYSVDKETLRADVFAMLLLGNDPNAVLNNVFEGTLLDLMRRQVASSIRRDAQLSGPFHDLFDKWIVRSSLANREDVLLVAMSWDSPSTLALALHTLDEATQAETILTCMQAISKFGGPLQTEKLKRFLDDVRPISNRGFAEAQTQPQIRDVTMLTIAMIHGIPFNEIEMPHVLTHPSSGFIPPDMAYPTNPDQSRARARKRIDQVLQAKAREES